jgi:hypothetical protein
MFDKVSRFSRMNLVPTRRQILVSTAAGSTVAMFHGSALAGVPISSGTTINPRDFGARCDGHIDDTVAIQTMFDHVAELKRCPPIIIDGPCRIEGTVVVKRPVDTTEQLLRIIGLGPDAGFVRTSSGTMFKGLLSGPNPTSEFLLLRDLVIRGERAEPASMFGDGLLRVTIESCEFYAIACLTTRGYAQEWSLANCIARGWEGFFFDAAGGYHVTTRGCKFQSGDGGFRLTDPSLATAGCIGCSFQQDIYESCRRSFLEFELGQGVNVNGLYSEGNASPTIKASLKSHSSAVSVTGCFFGTAGEHRSAPDFAEIMWGDVAGGSSIGNVALGRLHAVRAGKPRPTSVGDVASAAPVDLAQ